MRSVRSTLQRLGWLSLGLVVGSPVLVCAQTVSKEQLVGTWQRVVGVRRDEAHKPPAIREEVLTFRPDGTLQLEVNTEEGGGWTSKSDGRWDLAGDSLSFSGSGPKPYAVNKVVVRGQQLFIGSFIGSRGGRYSFQYWKDSLPRKLDPQEFECLAQHYQRIDPSKPRPAATLPPPPTTIKREDLVGTWVVTIPETYDYGAGAADTITLQADSTWTLHADPRSWSIARPSKDSNRWYLLPGDRLQLGNETSEKIVFQDQRQFFVFRDDWDQCFRDDRQHLVYKRITP